MKKFKFLLISVIALAFTSCFNNNEDVEFDKNLLIGKWSRPSDLTSGEDFYRYDANGYGATWDTGDDATEEDGQRFRWTLEHADLTHIHIIEMTGKEAIPKVYTVTELTATTLVYEDAFGKKFSFKKVK